MVTRAKSHFYHLIDYVFHNINILYHFARSFNKDNVLMRLALVCITIIKNPVM